MAKQTPSEKAVQVLTNFKNEIDKIDSINSGNLWKTKVMQSITIYLGECDLKISFHNQYFSRSTQRIIQGNSYSGRDRTETYHVYDESKKAGFKTVLDNIIEHIKIHGIINNIIVEPKANIASDLKPLAFWTTLFFYTSGAIGLGFWIENLRGDVKYNELNDKFINEKNMNKSLQDSIKTYKSKPKY